MNYRQGDVLLFGRKIRPSAMVKYYGWKEKGDNIIIVGEVSGHKHSVENGKLYEKDGKLILEAKEGCKVIHPEHEAISIPKGTYEIEIQEEYDEVKHHSKVKD